MPDEPRLEEQALSEAAQRAVSAQLDKAESLNVDIRTNLLKMVQGQAESASVSGEGLTIQKDIRVHELELHTDSIAIDLISALFGEVALHKPVDATARIVLTEPDINRALKSDYVRRQLQSLELNVEGQRVTLKPLQLEIHLPGNGKLGCSGTVLLHELGDIRRIGFSAMMRPRTLNQPLLLEAFNCTEGEGISLELAIALFKKAAELLNLPFLVIDGTTLRIKQLDVDAGSLTLHTEAYIKQIPNLHPDS